MEGAFLKKKPRCAWSRCASFVEPFFGFFVDFFFSFLRAELTFRTPLHDVGKSVQTSAKSVNNHPERGPLAPFRVRGVPAVCYRSVPYRSSVILCPFHGPFTGGFLRNPLFRAAPLFKDGFISGIVLLRMSVFFFSLSFSLFLSPMYCL